MMAFVLWLKHEPLNHINLAELNFHDKRDAAFHMCFWSICRSKVLKEVATCVLENASHSRVRMRILHRN